MRDIGPKAAAKSKGLVDLARCTQKNSERDFHNVADRFQLGLPIPLVTIPKPLGVRYEGDFNALSLCDWLKFHLSYNTFHILTGLARPDPKREQLILKEFWRRYKLLKPTHELWEVVERNGIDLGRTVPTLLHGDEGRGRKRQAFLILAYHSYLGYGTDLANKTRKTRPYLSQKLNYSGNAHTHRMLTAVLPKMSHDDIAFQSLINYVASDARRALVEGVTSIEGVRFHMAVVQIVGDWQFLAKAGNLSRSYANVEKRPRGAHAKPKGICHMCCAGQVGFPFEDLRETAAWKETLFLEEDHWFTSWPRLLNLPHDPIRPASFFAYDVWHAFHLGLGKVFAASVLAIISTQMEAGNIDGRFSELTQLYLDYCKESRSSPFLTIISKESIGWPDTKTYPNAQWSKGHITVLMLDFIADWFDRNGVAGDGLFPLCREANRNINAFMRELYSADVWLPAEEGQRIGQMGSSFLLQYMQLATQSFKSERALFMYMPKTHVLHHVIHTLLHETSSCQFCLNPLCHAVQIDEDYIGKISRISRRVSPLQAITRTLQRSLKAARCHYVQKGFLRG